MSKRSTTTAHSIEGFNVTMPDNTPAPSPPRSRGARIALIASLAVNALFVGGLVSALVRHGGGPHGPLNGNGPNGLGAYVSTLPAERGRAISAKINDKRQALGPLRREVRQARDDALGALAAEPFDKDKFALAQKHLMELENRQRLGQLDILAEIANSMTPDERRAFINWRGQAQRPGPATSIAITPPAAKP